MEKYAPESRSQLGCGFGEDKGGKFPRHAQDGKDCFVSLSCMTKSSKQHLGDIVYLVELSRLEGTPMVTPPLQVVILSGMVWTQGAHP